jgi:hypothetical protein
MPWAEIAAVVDRLRAGVEDSRQKVLCIHCGSDLRLPRGVPAPKPHPSFRGRA